MSNRSMGARHTRAFGTKRPARWALLLCGFGAIQCVSEVPRAEPSKRSVREARAADFLPDTVSIVAVLRDGDLRLDDFRRFLASRRLLDSKAYGLLAANPGFVQAQVGLRGIAASAELDAWSAVGTALGQEIALGVEVHK